MAAAALKRTSPSAGKFLSLSSIYVAIVVCVPPYQIDSCVIHVRHPASPFTHPVGS